MKPRWIKTVALKRIKKLLELAEEDREHASRYSYLALELSKKYNVSIPKQYKRRICTKCGAFLIPGVNLKIRTSSKPVPHILYICLKCSKIKKKVYKKAIV